MRSIAAVIGLLGAVYLASAWRHPTAVTVASFDAVRRSYAPSDATLVDRRGRILYELRVDNRHRRLEWTPLAAISPALVAAVLQSEDRRFYRHHGVDYLAVASAVEQRLFFGTRRGASTITMQLAAQLDPELQHAGSRRSLKQKWRQMRSAVAMESLWSKTAILEAYLNLISFRGEIQGVGAAARFLFGKQPHGIDDGEALILAALLRSPQADSEALVRRAGDLGLVPRSELLAAADRIERRIRMTERTTALAPHVGHRLLHAGDAAKPVVTTLDADVQRVAVNALRQNLLELRDRRVEDGAVVVADNESGDVLAYVGSSGDLSHARHVDAVHAPRQAGSSLKPFLYGLAFQQRLLTPASLLEDTPIEIAVGNGLYRPENYDDVFRGLVSVRTALASSINIPAVRTIQLVGPEAFVQHLRELGFSGLTHSGEHYGPSLALGSADVTLWELVSAYRTLARGGTYTPLRLQPSIATPEARRIYDSSTTFLISSILADRESRSSTFGLDNVLALPFWAAVKTGTSKDMRDNWCIGYSERYTVGVWVGNASGEPMQDVTGIAGAAPVWHEIMEWLHREQSSRAPQPPAKVEQHTVALATGTSKANEWFLSGTMPPPMAVNVSESPHILTPTGGTVFALDPDIPPSYQRVAFEARQVSGRAGWRLDGRELGRADTMLLWEPQPGRHTLQLVDAQHVVEEVVFTVRSAGQGRAGSSRLDLKGIQADSPRRAFTEDERS